MTIFSNAAPAYWAKGLPVIPLREKEKMPAIDGWQYYADRMPTQAEQDYWLASYAKGNIGIACGPQSDLAMIDIDTTDLAVIEVILGALKACGESPWKRVGAKGMVLAYRQPQTPGGLRTFQIKASNGAMIVEALSKGRQCVLPPSIHPSTQKPYEANCDLIEVYDDLPRISSQIEGILRQALIDHGLELSHSGWTRITDHVSVGSRDNQMTKVGGLWAQGITRGELTFLDAVGRMTAWHETCVDKADDPIDINKGISNLVGFLRRDVMERGKTLPKAQGTRLGWDDGLSDETKKAYGLDFVTHDHEEWTYEELITYLHTEFEKHGTSTSGWISTVEYVLQRLSRSKSLGGIAESKVLDYITSTQKSGVTKAQLYKQLNQIRQGDIAGMDHTEIAQAVLRMENEFGTLKYHHGSFWRWIGSHWEREDRDHLLGTIADKFGNLQAAKRRSDHMGILAVMGTLPDCHKPIKEDNRNGVNFANGFLTEDMRLVPHSPLFGCTYTLPYRYMPELAKDAIKWNGFLDRLWTGADGPDSDISDKKLALQEAMAATLFGVGTRYARAILLFGLTHTGKSQIIKVMQGLIPPAQVSSVSPEDWGDRFAPSSMADVLMNVAGELSETKKIDGKKFKEIVAGDTIHAQRKHEHGFAFSPTCMHWFGSNHLPKTEDSSAAFNRRWLVFRFWNQISDSERVLDIANELIAAEREHIVAWCVPGIMRLNQQRGYTLPESHVQMIREIADENCNVRYWLNNSLAVRVLPLSHGVKPTKTSPPTSEIKLYDAYSSFSRGQGGARPVILKNFQTRMSAIGGELGLKRRMVPTATGAEEPCWENIILVDSRER